MTHSKNLWLITVVCLAGAGATYAFAQPKPAAKPTAADHDKDGDTDEHAKHECKMHGRGGEHGCPMMQLSELADTKADNTKQGATVTFTAKKPEDTQKVQDLVKAMADHLSKGECPMKGEGPGGMMKGGMMGGDGHGHEHH